MFDSSLFLGRQSEVECMCSLAKQASMCALLASSASTTAIATKHAGHSRGERFGHNFKLLKSIDKYFNG